MIHQLVKDIGDEYVAVFRERSDGDWDFVAMFSLEAMPLMSQTEADPVSEQADCIAHFIADEGDNALIAYFPEPDVPSVYEWTPPTTVPET